METLQNYFLICGKIIFRVYGDDDKQEENVHIEDVTLNAILKQTDMNINVRSLGKAQQNLQMSFYRNLPDPSRVNVVEVVLVSITHLGNMTEAEFRAGADDEHQATNTKDEEVTVGVH